MMRLMATQSALHQHPMPFYSSLSTGEPEVSQRELGARVDPNHEPACAVRLEGCGDNDVAAGAEG